jgi:hypothetical protein
VSEPYLSVVVTARNDDHGGNLLGRMQTFLNNWLKQARRFGIPSELILVEWNPPADRPPLAQVLRWPKEPGPCTVRIIEVPPEIHRRLPHAAALPLYQMIAKNVGIRRARGKFVLATNIDIVFSSELAAFLAEQKLDPSRMYRIDRHDAMSDVPVDADPDEQLEYCRTHLVRINRRDGTFPADDTALPSASPDPVIAATNGAPAIPSTLPDPVVAAPAAAPVAAPVAPKAPPPTISFGPGWYPDESWGSQEHFRWAMETVSLRAERPPEAGSTMLLEVEPGPSAGAAVELEIAADGCAPVRVEFDRRCHLEIRADWTRSNELSLITRSAVLPSTRDPRTLLFRALCASWKGGGGAPRTLSARVRRLPLSRRAAALAAGVRHVVTRLAYEGPLVDLTVAVSPALRRFLRTCLQRSRGSRLPESQIVPPTPKASLPGPVFLHTNGCGDFTLLAREKWFDLRAYPEFDLFSMNLDSVFCFAAHHGGAPEEVLSDPMRIYHIEHGTGSGWTPEGQAKLFQRIEALGLSYLDNDTVLELAKQMRRLQSPMIFNGENWGFAADELRETVPVAGI